MCAAGALVAVLAKMGVACSANTAGSSNALPAVTVASITEVSVGLTINHRGSDAAHMCLLLCHDGLFLISEKWVG